IARQHARKWARASRSRSAAGISGKHLARLMRVTLRRSGTSQYAMAPITLPAVEITFKGKNCSTHTRTRAMRVMAWASLPSIEPRFTCGPRLEALVHPVVLLRHGGDALLDVVVHAARIRDQVVGRESLPRRLDGEQVARSARQHARHAG